MGIPKQMIHEQHLQDLPRYLRANRHPVIGKIVAAELARWANVYTILTAVLHQMEHGEASSLIDSSNGCEAGRNDLAWCREELRQAIKSLSVQNPD